MIGIILNVQSSLKCPIGRCKSCSEIELEKRKQSLSEVHVRPIALRPKLPPAPLAVGDLAKSYFDFGNFFLPLKWPKGISFLIKRVSLTRTIPRNGKSKIRTVFDAKDKLDINVFVLNLLCRRHFIALFS